VRTWAKAATSPIQEGVAGLDSGVLWIVTEESVIRAPHILPRENPSRVSKPDTRDQDDLDLCLSPIDEQFNSIDKTALIRGEEHGGLGNIVRIAQSP
jgi:hypothetical protein